ncbi:glycosyltransferase [Kineococcus rhizosphaerae]|nr:glycosyltransferase [Kineococcus rhizosphaerae]
MVTKFTPFPADGGGKLRSLAVLRRLASMGPTTLCCFADGTGDADALRAEGITVHEVPWTPGPLTVAKGILPAGSLSAARFHDARLAAVVREQVARQRPDLLQVEYSQLAPHLRAEGARVRALDCHNAEAALVASYAASAPPLRKVAALVEARLLERVERAGLLAADLVSVVSAKDAERLPVQPRRLVTALNGWEPRPLLEPASDPVAVFVGVLGWQPNADAAQWLAQQVWPHVRASLPQARASLVGRNPSPATLALAGDGLTVTGTVPDVQPYLQQARVALAPLRAGGGTRLKILEALAAGRPVVATSVGADGLEDLVGSGVVVADDPREFAARVVELLDDPARAQDLGRAGAAAVADRYSWDRVLTPWADAVQELVARADPEPPRASPARTLPRPRPGQALAGDGVAGSASTVITDLQQSTLAAFRPLLEGRDVALLDFPNHSNCGDSAIWRGEVAVAEALGCRVVYRCETGTYRREDIARLPESTAVLLHGGGNFGDLWPHFHAFRERVIADFPDRRIIQMPQSIHFQDPAALRRTQQLIAAHRDFVLVVRDHQSHALARTSFDCQVLLAPDMAFMLGARPRTHAATQPILALARTDHETLGEALDPVARAEGLNPVDWGRPRPPAHHPEGFLIRLDLGLDRLPPPLRTLGLLERRQGWIYEWQAEKQLQRGLEHLSRGEVVVTDRLHAHLLAELLGIPHVAMDSGYGKIRSYHETWLADSPLAHVETTAKGAVEKARQLSEELVAR